MILASLVRFAERKKLVEDPAFEKKGVDFVIVLNKDGSVRGLVSRREQVGKKIVAQDMLIPTLPKRTVKVTPGLLVDNAKYVLGIGEKDKPERLREQVQAFADRVATLAELKDVGVDAVRTFLLEHEARTKEVFKERPQSEWTGAELIAFQLHGMDEPVHLTPAVRAAISKRSALAAEQGVPVRCLVSGVMAPARRLHPALKRVPDGQSAGTTLVSFNGPAFESQGHEQGDNAPISDSAAIAYTTALNFMLEGTPTRRYRSGITLENSGVLLCWTDAKAHFEEQLLDMLDPPYVPTEQRSTKKKKSKFANAEAVETVRIVAEAPWQRLVAPAAEDDAAFCGLALSGNAARAVVRDAFSTTIGDVKTNVKHWFASFSLAYSGAVETPTIPMILRALDPPGTASAPPALSARLASAALRGTSLPIELLRHALIRTRREAMPKDVWIRAACCKAVLVQLNRLKETDVSLNEENTEPAYLLGRLFAVLERAQQNALGDVNATIRDRYFAAASSAPATVFPRLLRLAQHHIAKARAENREFGIEKKIASVVGKLPSTRFASFMPLADQGLFAVGYYHQRNDFFTKKTERND